VRLILARLVLRQTVLPQLQAQRLPASDEIRHALLGCDDGAAFEVSIQLPPMLRVPQPAQARARVPV
jgi:hypothetical protein